MIEAADVGQQRKRKAAAGYRDASVRWIATGCLLTQDPIGLAGGVNLYAFPGNNPIAFSDPFGLGPCEKEEDKNACSLAQEVYNQILNWLNGPKGRVAGALADALRTVGNALRQIPGVEDASEATAGVDFEGNTLTGSEQAQHALLATTQLVPTRSAHAVIDRASRGITGAMERKAIEKGLAYWDRLHNTNVYVLGTARGRTLYVAVNGSGTVTTSMIRRSFNPGNMLADGAPRWLPIP